MTTFIVPVSGGKDSQVVLDWALGVHSRKELRVVHQFTGYDHTLTLDHLAYMARHYKVNIEFTRNEKYADIFDFIRQVGYFPNSVARGCTSRLKQQPFAAWLRENKFTEEGACHIYMGMRSDESAKRTDKYGDLQPTDIFTLPDLASEYATAEFVHVKVSLPIVSWTTEEVFGYLKAKKVRINPLYAKGHHCVGCYPCLLARNAEWEAAAKDPLGREHIAELLKIEDEFVAAKNPRKLIKIHQSHAMRRWHPRRMTSAGGAQYESCCQVRQQEVLR